eukprot:EG_transcript_10943
MTVCGGDRPMKPIVTEAGHASAKKKSLQRELKPRLLSGTRPPVAGRKHVVWYASGLPAEVEFPLPLGEETARMGYKRYAKEPPSSVRSASPDFFREPRMCNAAPHPPGVPEALPRPPSSACSSTSSSSPAATELDDFLPDRPPSTPPPANVTRVAVPAGGSRLHKPRPRDRAQAKAAAGLVALRRPFRLRFPTVPAGPQLPLLWCLHMRCEQAKAMQQQALRSQALNHPSHTILAVSSPTIPAEPAPHVSAQPD